MANNEVTALAMRTKQECKMCAVLDIKYIRYLPRQWMNDTTGTWHNILRKSFRALLGSPHWWKGYYDYQTALSILTPNPTQNQPVTFASKTRNVTVVCSSEISPDTKAIYEVVGWRHGEEYEAAKSTTEVRRGWRRKISRGLSKTEITRMKQPNIVIIIIICYVNRTKVHKNTIANNIFRSLRDLLSVLL